MHPFFRLAPSALALIVLSVSSPAQQTPVNRANWRLAERYSAESLRPYLYSLGVAPGWINKGDAFWYAWRDPDGVRFWRVDAKGRKKEPLFDTDRMAALLSETTKRSYDRTNLPITTVSFDEKNDALVRFNVEWPTRQFTRYEYDREKDTLKSLGAATGREDTAPGAGQGRGTGGREFRSWSPDKKAYAYAQDTNLYLVEIGADGKEKPPVQLSKDGERWHSFGSRQELDEAAERRRLTGQTQIRAGGGQQLTGDGTGDDTTPTTPERRVRANVVWSDDSRRFVVARGDERKVKELYLVNSLTEPRPTLLTYKYDMPGEADVEQTEVWSYDLAKRTLERAPVEKWKDQTVRGFHFQKGAPDRLRFIRRDRLQRNLELCELDLTTKKTTALVTESIVGGSLELPPRRPRTVQLGPDATFDPDPLVTYVKPGGDMLWWSERSGWGHYYLYTNDGKLKNAVDSGPFRATALVATDERSAWITAVGREKDENPYYRHLYRVGLDGKAMTLLDPGNADHASSLSEDRKYLVDIRSRTDLEGQATLRDEDGKPLLELEKADVARLREIGWAMPETFHVKAADGVTDLWGNLWKPADFDAHKKYPIITYVYPGPQTEAVTTAFAQGITTTNARLAQLGFIVVSMGARGGNPDRSNAYQNYGYGNLRDYGLADKKVGIEQLAARYPWIDLDRVGIYGHSGGGFMTAAAMMLPPYNAFFKVGWSESGNHDNNVYNANWAEQYHGLREVPATATTAKAGTPEDEAPQFSTGLDGPTRFAIKVPTNAELAQGLKGSLMLVHGDMDDNVHYAGTYRLMNALMRANKRFDLLVVPGKPHAYGDLAPYVTQRMFEYFAEHLLGDRYGVAGADLLDHG